MSARKANKPWLGWTLGEKRVIPSGRRLNRRGRKNIQRKENIERLISEGKMK